MIMLSPVPQNGDVSSAAEVYYIKLWILSCKFFLVVMSGSLKDWQSSKEYLLCTLLPGGGVRGISFIFTSGQHCQMIDCANKYFCYSCNLYYIRDCFFKRFFFVAFHY